MADHPQLRIGTCSWNYDSWVDLVYSEPRSRAVDYLGEYAARFDTAEIDSWFYRVPDSATIAEYLAAVPDGFRFTCKVPQQITLTHKRPPRRGPSASPSSGAARLEANPDFLSVDRFTEFLAAIEPMLPRIDAIMLEFEYLNRQKMTGGRDLLSRLAAFFGAVPGGPRYAVEPRNPGYLTAEWFDTLCERGVAHVFSQKIHMPPIWEVYTDRRDAVARCGHAVIRLLGGDRKEIERVTGGSWDRIVDPRPEELDRIAEMVRSMLDDGVSVTVSVNNHYEGSAPRTVESLRERLA
ncbi:MAG: DUF72 domain-containing protein [Spirochaetaceae bacterium]|nr:MAG: DUF72 domain-containing protein [Spirochaetaceae bacterium]